MSIAICLRVPDLDTEKPKPLSERNKFGFILQIKFAEVVLKYLGRATQPHAAPLLQKLKFLNLLLRLEHSKLSSSFTPKVSHPSDRLEKFSVI